MSNPRFRMGNSPSFARAPGTRQAAFLLAAALAHGLAAAADPDRPEESLYKFYSWVLANPAMSLPLPAKRKQLERMASPQLIGLLAEASTVQAKCIKAAREGNKPDIFEGALLVGNHEGATEVKYGPPQPAAGAVRFEVTLLHIDSKFPKAHDHRISVWKDDIELRRYGQRWLVSEVIHRQSEPLSGILKKYIADGTRKCSAP